MVTEIRMKSLNTALIRKYSQGLYKYVDVLIDGVQSDLCCQDLSFGVACIDTSGWNL